MVTNWPGPYDMRFFYTVQGRDHVQKLNCSPTTDPAVGTALGDIDLELQGGGVVDAETAADDWADLMKTMFSDSGAVINRVELWKYDFESYNATYVNAHALLVDGTNVLATVPASQGVMTFRTTEGGVLKLNFLDTVFPAAIKEAFPAANAGINAIAGFVSNSTNWILGRDTSYPILALNWLPGQNERLFKEIYR